MQHFVRDSIVCLLLILVPTSVNAVSRIKDADAVITMRNGQPCFSYPQDEEIRKRPYSFAHLGVSKNTGGVRWEIGIASIDRKGLIEPNTPEACIEYDMLRSGTKVIKPAEPLENNIPYHVIIRVTEPPNAKLSYKRLYYTDFCIVYNENNEPVVVGASGGGKGQWRCLKPGETPKRGFWDSLFGK